MRMETLSPVRGRWLIRVAVALVAAASLLMLGITLAGGNLTDALDDLVTILLAVGVVGYVVSARCTRADPPAASSRTATAQARRGHPDRTRR